MRGIEYFCMNTHIVAMNSTVLELIAYSLCNYLVYFLYSAFYDNLVLNPETCTDLILKRPNLVMILFGNSLVCVLRVPRGGSAFGCVWMKYHVAERWQCSSMRVSEFVRHLWSGKSITWSSGLQPSLNSALYLI